MASSAWAEIEFGLECTPIGSLANMKTQWHRIDIENKEVLWSGNDWQSYELEKRTLEITDLTDTHITYISKRKRYTKRLHYRINRYAESDFIFGKDMTFGDRLVCKSYEDEILLKRRDLFYLERETKKKF